MNRDNSVLVAMSGGVDSSAAALLLQDEGKEVVGVSMQVWDYRNHGGNSAKATCCSPADFDDARQIADRADFPFYVFDFEGSFFENVISPFVDSYTQGNTPNPCLECNRKIKFKELRRRAATLGIQKVATGHYAQVKELENGEVGLFTGKDLNKDQSYFLYAMTQDELKNTLFPVGSMEKSDVREFLRKKNYTIAEKGESQDICFVTGAVADFVEKISKRKMQSGDIVNRKGEVLGKHSGIHNYTVGQRKGLGISHDNPLYVVKIDALKNEVVVGEKDELEQNGFIVIDAHWISRLDPACTGMTVLVKMRYRHPGVPCRIINLEDDRMQLEFVDEWSVVSPGQAAVFYSIDLDAEGDRQVLGGGTISVGSQRGDV